MISIYGEKTLHRELKWYLEPRSMYHEVRVGKYIADIKNGDSITEIQTRALYKLNDKLAAFLPDYVVTLVYPIIRTKQIAIVDIESGTTLKTRRSPKRGNFYSAYPELYQIREFLTNHNLRLRLLLIDVLERRQPDGPDSGGKIGGETGAETGIEISAAAATAVSGRRGRRRRNKIDSEIKAFGGDETIDCGRADDFGKLVPEALGEKFTTVDFAAAASLSKRDAGMALNVLHHVGVIQNIGKSGRYNLYARY